MVEGETKKCTARIDCHRVLGIIAARRGDAARAEAAFMAGKEEARETGVYLLELMCVRDVVQFVYEGRGPDEVARGEAMGEEAAARMGGKTRADFEELWAMRRAW